MLVVDVVGVVTIIGVSVEVDSGDAFFDVVCVCKGGFDIFTFSFLFFFPFPIF